MEPEHDLQEHLNALREHRTILFPLGEGHVLAADATSDEAVLLLAATAKEQDAYCVLVAEEQDILQYVAAPDPALFDYLEEQEQPVTVWYEGVIGLSEHIPDTNGAIPIRIEKDTLTRALVKRLGKPLFTVPVMEQMAS